MVAPRTNNEQEAKLDGIYVIRTANRRALIGCRHRAQLQKSGPSGTGFPHFERSGSVDSTIRHRTEDRVPATFSYAVGVLRGVASKAGVGTTVV